MERPLPQALPESVLTQKTPYSSNAGGLGRYRNQARPLVLGMPYQPWIFTVHLKLIVRLEY